MATTSKPVPDPPITQLYPPPPPSTLEHPLTFMDTPYEFKRNSLATTLVNPSEQHSPLITPRKKRNPNSKQRNSYQSVVTIDGSSPGRCSSTCHYSHVNPPPRKSSLANARPKPITSIFPAWLHLVWTLIPLSVLGLLGMILLYAALRFQVSNVIFVCGISGYFFLCGVTLRVAGLLMEQSANLRWLKATHPNDFRRRVSLNSNRRISFAPSIDRTESAHRPVVTWEDACDEVELGEWQILRSPHRTSPNGKNALSPPKVKADGRWHQRDRSEDLTNQSVCLTGNANLTMHQARSQEPLKGEVKESDEAQDQEVLRSDRRVSRKPVPPVLRVSSREDVVVDDVLLDCRLRVLTC